MFLDMSPKVMETKAKINQWDLVKLNRICSKKEIINKTEKTAYGMEKKYLQMLQPTRY